MSSMVGHRNSTWKNDGFEMGGLANVHLFRAIFKERSNANDGNDHNSDGQDAGQDVCSGHHIRVLSLLVSDGEQSPHDDSGRNGISTKDEEENTEEECNRLHDDGPSRCPLKWNQDL